MSGLLPYAVVVLVTLAVTVGGILTLQSHADQSGYTRCTAEVKSAETINLTESIKNINEAFAKVQILEDELENYQDGDASPSMQRTLNELRKRHPNQNSSK